MDLWKKIIRYIDLRKRAPLKCHSIYALMPNGSMAKDSISLLLYNELLAAYNDESYTDAVTKVSDKEALLSAIAANFKNECDVAWSNFLAEIKEDD